MSTAASRIAIIGGGAARIATAASMLKRRPGLDIAIVEPSDTHAYRPGWTMVGGGVFDVATKMRPAASVIPRGTTWIWQAAASFQPERNQVTLADSSTLAYEVLIVATGIRLAWEKIAGLEATLGKNGVTSNYRADLLPYTWELVQQVRAGRAIFTQPPMPNIFGLGDGGSKPEAKTVSAVRKRAPAVAVNAHRQLDGKGPTAGNDGYGSCPLTVERGRIVLAEFAYGGKLAPGFPTWLIDGTKANRLSWMLKADFLPWLYWNGMLKGREWLAGPGGLIAQQG